MGLCTREDREYKGKLKEWGNKRRSKITKEKYIIKNCGGEALNSLWMRIWGLTSLLKSFQCIATQSSRW